MYCKGHVGPRGRDAFLGSDLFGLAQLFGGPAMECFWTSDSNAAFSAPAPHHLSQIVGPWNAGVDGNLGIHVGFFV